MKLNKNLSLAAASAFFLIVSLFAIGLVSLSGFLIASAAWLVLGMIDAYSVNENKLLPRLQAKSVKTTAKAMAPSCCVTAS